MKKPSTINKKSHHPKRELVVKTASHPSKGTKFSENKHLHSEGDNSTGKQRHHSGEERSSGEQRHYRRDEGCSDARRHSSANVTCVDQNHTSGQFVLFDSHHPLLTPKFVHKDGFDVLRYLTSSTVDIHIKFRDALCDECSWSVPTYYRKIGRDTMRLSNAEFEKICQVYKDILIDATVDFYAKASSTNLDASDIYAESWHYMREGSFNTLWYMHNRFALLSRDIREQICWQCGWSVPSYYRKVRSAACLSNADFEGICKIYKDFLIETLTDFHRFSRGLWPLCNE